jgi:hypothetical protein
MKPEIQHTRDSIREYVDLVKHALTRIAPHYFRLPTTYMRTGIVRERLFCYELYHQIRSSMLPHHELSLHGEIDKRGHADFAEEDRVNPDFVFHVAGTHFRNTLVIEVKGTDRYREGILKDFKTILNFINIYGYRAGIFILYNHSFAELEKSVGDKLGPLKSDPSAKSVYILSVREPQTECEEHLLSEI